MMFTAALLRQKGQGKPHFSEEERVLHKEREAELGGKPPFLIPGPTLTPELCIAFPLFSSSPSQSYIVLGDSSPL